MGSEAAGVENGTKPFGKSKRFPSVLQRLKKPHSAIRLCAGHARSHKAFLWWFESSALRSHWGCQIRIATLLRLEGSGEDASDNVSAGNNRIG